MKTDNSDQLDDREQNDPDEVDEVPVEAERLDTLVMFFRELAEEGLARHVSHAHDAAEDVESVEARRREEDGAEQRYMRVEALMQQLVVLDPLNRDEDRSEEEGQRQEKLHLPEIAALGRRQRLHHRHGGADEDEGVRGRQRHVQNRRRPRPERTRKSENDVRADEAREEHH